MSVLGLDATGWVWVIEHDGSYLAYGGVVRSHDVWSAFFWMDERAKSFRRTLNQALVTVRKRIQSLPVVYAIRDVNLKTSDRLLRWFGFEPTGEGEVYQWTR